MYKVSKLHLRRLVNGANEYLTLEGDRDNLDEVFLLIAGQGWHPWRWEL